MKHFLISAAAMTALVGCGGSTAEVDPLAGMAEKIEAETNYDALLKLDAEASAKVEEAMNKAQEAVDLKHKSTVAIGSLFLTNNAAAEGVVTTESGLQYKVVQAGLENGAKAQPGQGIAAHYHGFFINKEVFDSSYQRGSALRGPSNGFIKGWNEALGDMKVCEARTLYINSNLAYGDNGRGGIPGGATLIFNMQLLEVQKAEGSEGVFMCPEEKILSGPEAY